MFANYDAFMVPGPQNKTPYNREGSLPMSIGLSGLDTPCCVQPVTIEVSPTHPLIQRQLLRHLLGTDIKSMNNVLWST